MKKRKIFFVIFSLLIISNLLVNELLFKNISIVNYYVTKPEITHDYVISNGIIEYNKKKTIKSNSSLVINKINVKNGSKIKKGDLLFECTKSEDNISNNSLSEEELYEAYLNGDFSKLKKYNTTTSNSENEFETVNIYSEFSGKILNINYEVGDKVSENTVLAQIVTDNSLNISLEINENQISKLNKNQKVIITGKAFEGTDFTGTVKYIGNEAITTTSTSGKSVTVDVKVSIDYPNEKLKSGYTAKCSIITNTDKNSIVIPYNALKVENSGQEYVYCYENGYAKKVNVISSDQVEDGIKITKGLGINKIVLIDDNLYNGKRINLKRG